MTDRLSCCVPGCHRTFEADGSTEVICGKHWQLADRRYRRLRGKLTGRYARRFGDTPFWGFPAGSPKRLEAVKLERLISKLWDRCKKQAIERAMGI